MPFSAIVYRPVGIGSKRTHAAHVLYGPYASGQLAHQAGVAYAKAKGLSSLNVGTVEASKVDQFFAGTGKHYLRQNPRYGIGRKIPLTQRIVGREFEARDLPHAKKKVQRLAQRTGKDYYVWERNPTASAIPSKWTPATITRRRRQIQIWVGGSR